LFGKAFGFEKLTKIMKNNTEAMRTKDMTARSKSVVSAAMKTAKSIEEFEKALQKNGMDVVFRQNDEGRIYGVTFIDHENREVLNGSRLGKEFSANVFHNLFNQPANCPQQPISPISPISSNTSNSINSLPSSNSSSPANTFDASPIEELFGIFDIKPRGEDYEETAFARKMRKKKKRTISP
jgi:hypothetical protein